MVGQRLGGPIFTWGNQVPDETLNILITAIMQQAVGKEGSADCFHIGLLQGALEAAMSQDVTPPSPTIDVHPHTHKKRDSLIIIQIYYYIINNS